MERKRIKNLIIIVLIILNAFLAGVVITDRIAAAAAARALKSSLYEAMAQNGVSLSADAVIEGPPPSAQTMIRDLNSEKQMAERVIGKCSVSDLGGNIMYYGSDGGRAQFHGNGEFDIATDPGNIPKGGSAEQTAISLLNKMGLEALALNTTDNGEITTVTAHYSFNRTPIYNAGIVFTFSESSLILISGQRPPDKPGVTEASSFDAATVLMRFIDLIHAEGYVCSEIKSLSPGYIMNDTAPGGVVLVPVWKIETDSGLYFINGLTGNPEPIIYP